MPQKARNYAFLLLKFRLRSEKELRQRLEQKKFSAQAVSSTVSFLKEKGFIDDACFAKAWAESRIKRPLGLRRIRDELKAKGIDAAIINNQISQIKKDYPEQEIVLEIAKKRFSRFKGTEPEKAKRRIYAYLLRRGFLADTIIEALSQL